MVNVQPVQLLTLSTTVEPRNGLENLCSDAQMCKFWMQKPETCIYTRLHSLFTGSGCLNQCSEPVVNVALEINLFCHHLSRMVENAFQPQHRQPIFQERNPMIVSPHLCSAFVVQSPDNSGVFVNLLTLPPMLPSGQNLARFDSWIVFFRSTTPPPPGGWILSTLNN